MIHFMIRKRLSLPRICLYVSSYIQLYSSDQVYSGEQFSLTCDRGVRRSFDQWLSRPGWVTTQYPGPGRIPRAFSAPATAKDRTRDQKFGKQRGVATKLPRSHRTASDPGHLSQSPELTSDPRSGRETAEQGCITAEQLGPHSRAGLGTGYLQALCPWPGPPWSPSAFILPPQLCLDTRPGDIPRPCWNKPDHHNRGRDFLLLVTSFLSLASGS